jgi:VWFA-related protein
MRAAWKRLAGLAVLPTLAFAGAVLAQDRTFTEATDVTVVEIPVQVLLDGKPVRGLEADDFIVLEDKRKQPVTGFERVDLYALPAAGAQEVPAPARRHFLLLFDLSFSEPKSVLQARAAAKGLLGDLHASDLVAVATYTASRGPELVLGFTPDRSQVAAAIDTLGLPELIDRNPDPLKLVVAEMETANNFVQAPQGGGGGEGAEGRAGALSDLKADLNARMLNRLEAFARESEKADLETQKDKVTALARSFTDLAKLMRTVAGRKYVVYLSEGYDSALLTGTTEKADEKKTRESAEKGEIWEINSEKRFGDSVATNEIDAMLQELRRADCVIQAVDIGGLRGAAGQGYERRGGKDSLFQMASDTGGDLYENWNDLGAAMGTMLERTGVTYVLTIQPETAADGTYHPLRVELKGGPRGARVVHRPGYFAPRPFAQRSRYEKMLITAGQVLVGEEGGTVRASILAAPMPSGAGTVDVPLVVEVDGPGLLQDQQGADLPAEIYVYALDGKGTVRDYIAQTLVLDLGKVEGTLRQSGLKFYGHLELPAGSYKVRLMVRNGRTGGYGVRVLPLEVPGPAAAGPVLLPPFFPAPKGQWLLTREAPRPGRRDVPLPFRLGDEPFLPAAKPVLDDGQEARFSVIGYNLDGELQVRSQVLTADGREVERGELALVGRQPGGAGEADRLELEFRPADLQPGEYLLRVTVTDAAGKAGTSTAPFVVAAGGPGERS